MLFTYVQIYIKLHNNTFTAQRQPHPPPHPQAASPTIIPTGSLTHYHTHRQPTQHRTHKQPHPPPHPQAAHPTSHPQAATHTATPTGSPTQHRTHKQPHTLPHLLVSISKASFPSLLAVLSVLASPSPAHCTKLNSSLSSNKTVISHTRALTLCREQETPLLAKAYSVSVCVCVCVSHMGECSEPLQLQASKKFLKKPLWQGTDMSDYTT